MLVMQYVYGKIEKEIHNLWVGAIMSANVWVLTNWLQPPKCI